MGASSVECEKNVPVFYKDSNSVVHTIGTERIDILFRYNNQVHMLELKATTTGIREHMEIQQLRKYHDALKYLQIDCDHMYVINFSQAANRTEVEFAYFNHLFENKTDLITSSRLFMQHKCQD